MKNYSARCPAPGCKVVFRTAANNWEEAFRNIYSEGNKHMVNKHPDFPENVEDRVAAARKYAKNELKEVE